MGTQMSAESAHLTPSLTLESDYLTGQKAQNTVTYV